MATVTARPTTCAIGDRLAAIAAGGQLTSHFPGVLAMDTTGRALTSWLVESKPSLLVFSHWY